MKQIILTTVLAVFITFCKAQSDTKITFANINQYTNSVDATLAKIDINIKKDKHKEMDGEIHNLESDVEKIISNISKLPENYSSSLTVKAIKLKSDANEFETKVHKSSIFDKDKALTVLFNQLKSSQTSFKESLKQSSSAYAADIAVQEQPQIQEQTPVVQNNELNNDSKVLAEINQEAAKIKLALDNINIATKKTDNKSVAKLAKEIANSSGKISDLSMLAKGEQKDNIKTLAVDAKLIATKLHKASEKIPANHHDAHEHKEQLETKLSTLLLAISTLK